MVYWNFHLHSPIQQPCGTISQATELRKEKVIKGDSDIFMVIGSKGVLKNED
jgi:hypothetical protein